MLVGLVARCLEEKVCAVNPNLRRSQSVERYRREAGGLAAAGQSVSRPKIIEGEESFFILKPLPLWDYN